MNREFMVEVNIFHANGENLDDWKVVNRLNEDVSEDTIKMDSKVIAERIAAEVQKFCSSGTKPVASPNPVAGQ